MRVALTAAAIALIAVGAAFATTLRRVTLDDMAERSREIVVGTVQATKHVAGPDERAFVMTEVKLGKLDVWRGAVDGSTTSYRFVGGTRDGKTLTVPGVPRLKQGERVVLFVDGDDELCPLVGWEQGCLRIQVDDRTGTETVADAAGRAIYGFESGLPVRAPSAERPRPLSLVELKVEVVRALEAAAERAREAAEDAEQPDEGSADPKTERPPAPARDGDER